MESLEVVVQTFSPNIQEAEAGGSWSIRAISRTPKLQRNPVSKPLPKKKMEKELKYKYYDYF